MNKTKHVWLMLIAALALTACMESDPAGDGNATLGSSPMAIDISYTELMRYNDKMYQTSNTDCNSVSGEFRERWQDSTHYTIANGKLTTWSDYSCYTTVYTGTSKTLVGTWTLSQETAAVPSTRENRCALATAPMLGYTGTVAFTSTTVDLKLVQHDYCWADLTVKNSKPADSLVKVGCNKYSQTVNGKIATHTLLAKNAKAKTSTIQVTYGDSICTRNFMPDIEATEASCHTAWSSYQADVTAGVSGTYLDKYLIYPEELANIKAFETCLKTSGLENNP